MQNKKRVFKAVLMILLAAPVGVLAQGSSINTYSPYTFTGLGEMSTQGPAFLRSMGGIGTAFRSPWMINYLNPASNSAVSPRTFLLNFGMEGGGYYLKNATQKTSFNTFNVRDVAVRFPLAKGIGMGVNVTPFSSVGYRVNNSEYLAPTYDEVKKTYSGEGGLSQINASIGAQVFKNFSLGAEMIFYTGSINRYFNTSIIGNNSGVSYNPTTASQTESVSRLFAKFGMQYDIIANDKRALTLGATYQLQGKLNSNINRSISSNNVYGDVVSDTTYKSDYRLPGMLSVGVFYHTEKFSIGADYSLQMWKGINKNWETDKMKYRDANTFSLGGQYTPNRRDIRRFLNRWTYRAGVRYSTTYTQIDGRDINDKAITVGIGIPVKISGLSNINLGMELGEMGTVKHGLIRQRYMKFSIGLSLFGEDYWFVKQKYD